MACFACGKSFKREDTYICINRYQKLRSASGADEILSGISPLKICIYCAGRACAEPIILNNEIPLLNIEKEGFYWYVKHLSGVPGSWKMSNPGAHCSLCQTSIDSDHIYTQIEISEEHKNQDGSIQPVYKTTATLAVVCETCSQLTMAWI